MQQQKPKLTAVQERQLDKLQEQFVTMAGAGIELIERYGAGKLEKAESEVLMAMGASLFASYFGNGSALAKKTAIGIALRAAFCYGQEQGRNAASGEPGDDDGDGAGSAGTG